MSAAVRLENVLSRHQAVTPHPEVIPTSQLKDPARFWFGSKESNRMRKDECVRRLTQVLQDPVRIGEALRTLPDKEQDVLKVYKRYGGHLSGTIARAELLVRALVDPPDPRQTYGYVVHRDDPITKLQSKMLLLNQHGAYNPYDQPHYQYGYGRSFPELTVLPHALKLITPTSPLPWKASTAATAPRHTVLRPAAEVTLDLWMIAETLAHLGTWKTTRGGTPLKPVENRLTKLLPDRPEDPLTPPQPWALYYALLQGLGAITQGDKEASIDLAAVSQHLRSPAPVQAWHHVRAWLAAQSWQDGVGLVTMRQEETQTRGWGPQRETLAWALSRVAHAGTDWLDLEAFVIDLGTAIGQWSSYYWGATFAWNPRFQHPPNRRSNEFLQRQFSLWLDGEGVWTANALMATLVYLGLVERGSRTTSPESQPCFRLTPLGRSVFGAPEVTSDELGQDPKFLTVQPNHEVLAFMDQAEAGAIGPLALMARRTSTTSGPVQTFALTRDSVYAGLESGLALEEMQRFLTEHSRTGLPENVAQSLMEWSRKREALVLRSDVTLGVRPPGAADPFPETARGRRLSNEFVLLPKTAVRSVSGCLILDHEDVGRKLWEVDENGEVRVAAEADSIALARLAQFADPVGERWRITAASVRRARQRGITGEQILGWMDEYLVNELAPLLRLSIRNWATPARVFLGSLLMLQVPQAAVGAVRDSEQFRPFLAGHIPPDWFLIRAEKQRELEQLLTEMGFVTGTTYKLGTTLDTEEETPRRQTRKGRRKRTSE